jgi:outer membrane protein assembly factor BamB
MQSGSRCYAVAAAALGSLLLAGCGGKAETAPQVPRRIDPAELSLAELDRRPAPDGVDPATWTQLKAALAQVLAQQARTSSAARPLTAGSFPVRDLTAAPYAGTVAELQWSYGQNGDYDLNGFVTISDLGPLGRYFGLNSDAPNWSEARVADGNDDGLINIADITPLGANFGRSVDAFELLRFPTALEPDAVISGAANPLYFTLVAAVPFGAGSPQGAGLRFSISDPAGYTSATYLVRPIQYNAAHPQGHYTGAYSNLATVPFAAGPWPMAGHDPQRTYRTSALGPLRASLAWTYNPSPYRQFKALQVVGGDLYAEDNAHVDRISADGTYFEFPYGGTDNSSLAWFVVLADGAVLALYEEGTLCCWEADGSERFRTALDLTQPSSGATLTATGDAYFYAWLNSQLQLLRCTPAGVVEAQFPVPAARLADRPLFFGNGDILVRYNEDQFQRRAPDGTVLAASAHFGTPVYSLPVIGPDERVYVENGAVHVLSPQLELLHSSVGLQPGGPDWQPSPESICVDPASDRIYVVPYDTGTLYALDLQAELRWSQSLLADEPFGVLPVPLLSNGLVVVAGSEGLRAVDPEGAQAWSFDTLQDAYSLAVAADGTIHAAAYDGNLYTLEPGGELRATRRMFHNGVRFSNSLTSLDGAVYFIASERYLGRVRTGQTAEVEFTFLRGTTGMATMLLDPTGRLNGTARQYDPSAVPLSERILSRDHTGVSLYELPLGGTPGPLYAPGLLTDGTLLHVSGNTLYAVDSDGNLRFSFDAGDALLADPAVSLEGVIYLVGARTGLISLDVNGNEIAERVSLSGGGQLNSAGIAVNADSVLVTTNGPSSATSLQCFNRATLAFQWSALANTMGHCSNPALSTSGAVYIAVSRATVNGQLIELLAVGPDGSPSWSAELPGYTGDRALLVDGAGNIYAACAGSVAAFTAEGDPLWTQPLVAEYPGELALAADGTLYAVGDGFISALEP